MFLGRILAPEDIVAAINQAHEQTKETPRDYLGCSVLGHHCDRYLWLTWKQEPTKPHSGRILRLFRRGHMEEETVYDDLSKAGFVVTHKQASVQFGEHVKGHTDGVVKVDGVNHLLEIKTHSLKSFRTLERDGVNISKPVHWAQMQLYMHGTHNRNTWKPTLPRVACFPEHQEAALEMLAPEIEKAMEPLNLKRALYYAVCKDSDALHLEFCDYNQKEAEALVRRGLWITSQEREPEPVMGGSPSWYQCKMCDFHGRCWG